MTFMKLHSASIESIWWDFLRNVIVYIPLRLQKQKIISADKLNRKSVRNMPDLSLLKPPGEDAIHVFPTSPPSLFPCFHPQIVLITFRITYVALSLGVNK